MKGVLISLLGFCLFWPPSCLAQQCNASDGIGRTVLPFHISNGFLIVIEGRIGALSKLKFILDTGATRSIVDRKIADRLSISRRPKQTFDFDTFILTEQASIPDLQFGPIEVTNVLLAITKLEYFSTFARHADAVIGSDLLSLTPFTIDYDRRRVEFGCLQDPESAKTRSFNPSSLTLELLVQGQRIRLLVDTGFPGILLFEGRLRKRAPLLKLEHRIEGFQMGNRSRISKAAVPDANLGARSEKLGVLLTDDPQDNVLPGIDGLWGSASLKVHRSNFNYATNSLTGNLSVMAR
jgi:predicted aspartyl protease